MDVLTWIGEGDGSIIGVDPGEYCSWGFFNLVVVGGSKRSTGDAQLIFWLVNCASCNTASS